MARRHDPQEVSSFLDGDLRQVWALDRATGQAHYLEQGQASALRERARSEWRCPVPGCSVEITTVGGDRRHHFRHLRLEDAPHACDGESEAHLAAKAMLAAWAAARLPPGTTVREEETIKDPATALHRIADVMVSWPNATKTAFEVEYKPYTPEAWRQKQADYDTKSLPCVWLLGHTRIKPAPPKGALVEWSNMVKVPALGAAFAAKGRHVLVINPMTRQIGTLAGHPGFTERVTKYDAEAWLAVDDIEDCDLDPDLGLITPTMQRIDAAIEARRREAHRRADLEAKKARERAEREANKARERDYWTRVEAARRAEIEANSQAAWDASYLKQRAHALWGEDLPELLTYPAPDPEGIFALPVHWHTALYRHLIHRRPRGHTFTIKDCRSQLEREGIQTSRIPGKAYKALAGYLEVLEWEGLVRIQRSYDGWITSITTRERTIDDLLRRQEERWQRQQELQRRQEQADLAEQQRRDAEAHRREQERQQERQRRIAAEAEQADRWETSGIRRQVADSQGAIPAAIAWAGGLCHSAIDAAPPHWHAHIYQTHIHAQPAGTPVDVHAAIATLNAVEIQTPGPPDDVITAISDYLYNLMQRGILTCPNGDCGEPSANAYAVR